MKHERTIGGCHKTMADLEGVMAKWLKIAIAMTLLIGGCERREDYPQRPIMLICPWSAGGGTDRVARQLAAQLEGELDVPVNVINATGGAGVTGHTRGAVAPADGYTITIVTAELNMLHWRGLTNITYKDYEPLALINRDAAALFVRDDAPWKDIAELVEAIRSDPGKYKASGTAFGGIWHVALAGWLTHSGLNATDVTWISINGSAPSLQELLAGGVDMVCCSVGEAASLLEGGRVRCLAVMDEQRNAQLPDVPTLRECGIDWSLTTWRGIAAPRGIGEEQKRILSDALHRVATSERFREFMDRSGFGATYVAGDRFREELQRMDAQFGEIFRSDAFRSVQRQTFGPYTFPAVLAVLLFAVGAAMAVLGQWRRPQDVAPLTKSGLWRIAVVPLWVIIYAAFAGFVGFVPLATVLTVAMMWQLGVRFATATGIALVVVPIVYQVFAVQLRVPLPWGWLGW